MKSFCLCKEWDRGVTTQIKTQLNGIEFLIDKCFLSLKVQTYNYLNGAAKSLKELQ